MIFVTSDKCICSIDKKYDLYLFLVLTT